MAENCVVVGASHAAAQLCISLRQGGWDGDITVFGAEEALPYHRPPLSKEFLAGDKTLEDLLIRPAEAYEQAQVTFHLGTSITEIDRTSRTVVTDQGKKIAYDKLVLAMGASVRRLSVPGATLSGIYYLRDFADVQAIQANVATGKRAVIIGGGYIGLETAASLTRKGMQVTVLEAMPRILQRVTAPEVSTFYKRVHTEEGVRICEDETVEGIEEESGVLQVATDEGHRFEAEMVVVGIGVVPNTGLAEAADLACSNGVEVNEFGQTSDPDIYATGDVTWHYNPLYERHVRLESVPNATDQSKVVAAALNGKPKAYDSLPWFWSDQFDLKLQIAGLSDGYDDIVIRGDIETSRSFAAFYFRGERLIAVDAVNRPQEFMLSKRLIPAKATPDKKRLADENVALKEFMVK